MSLSRWLADQTVIETQSEILLSNKKEQTTNQNTNVGGSQSIMLIGKRESQKKSYIVQFHLCNALKMMKL